MNDASPTKQAIDISIKLVILAAVIGFCIVMILPFGSIMIWAIILAMALSPLYLSLSERLGGRNKLSATILVLVGLLIILIPAWLFVDSIIEGVRDIRAEFEADSLTIPPPTDDVKDWPLIGDELYAVWNGASVNLEETIVKYKDQLASVGNSILESILNIGGSIFQFIVSTIIAGVLLVTTGTNTVSVRFFDKLVPGKGDEVADIAQKTVNNVVKGVLGVALIQAFLIGVGLLLAGVPYAGLWTLLVFVLAVLQLPASLVTIPAIVYLFSVMGTLPAVLWTIFLLAAGLSDNVLKPILLGKGAPVPMLVIFLGVIGGFMTLGFIGLFIGAIVLSLGYKLFMAWLEPEKSTA